MDFNQEPRKISFFNLPDKFSFLNPCSMSDENGNLIFYSNGCKIINHQHQLMENGQDINPGPVHDQNCKKDSYDYDDMQGMVGVPFPERPGRYILFHCAREFALNMPSFTARYYYSEIDMNANGGLGRVVKKNEPLFGPDSIDMMATAARHGNGRDWWVITGRRFSNVFYLYLVTPEGVKGPFVEEEKDTWVPGHYSSRSAAFSPDGSKFIRVSYGPKSILTLFQFDRCRGTLHSPVQFSLPEPDTLLSDPWPAFSPNSRYLYIQNQRYYLYQFDTWAKDLTQSGVLIGKYDGFRDTSDQLLFPTIFHSMTTAPDGKIYMATGTSTIFLHVIHAPDLPGLACDFRQHDIAMPTNIAFFVPSFPNYRLRDWANSPCDTLGISTSGGRLSDVTLQLRPNPAHDVSELQVQGHTGPVQVRVCNVLGQMIYQTEVRVNEAAATLPVGDWPSGCYMVWAVVAGEASRSFKLVVQR